MAQPNPGGQPPTFKSNVNRAKTKKWIEAKSYSYDGDDWGEVDDYDEYGGYEEPPALPPLALRNTGLRQRGQSASQPVDQGGPPVQKSPYGEPVQPQPQQSQAARSFTQPPQPSSVRRQNSFEPDQERRAFSNGPPLPLQSGQKPAAGAYPTPAAQSKPATQDFQQNPAHPNQSSPAHHPPPPSMAPRQGLDDHQKYAGQAPSPSGPYRGSPSPQRPLKPTAGSRDASIASNDSSLDFHNRRDFSPSAMPLPLQPRGSPSPSQGGGRPPRTSSLGQDNAPQIPFPTQTPVTASNVEPTDGQHPQRDRASSSQSNKSLPFVRPADIYRRMEEERQRERRSQESSRPSMESITGRPKPESKKDGEGAGRPRQISNLNPVHERRQSEMALEGLETNAKAAGGESQTQTQPTEKRPTTSKRFEIKKPSAAPSQSGAPSLGPILPNVDRISSFGDSFGESFMGSSGGLGDFSSLSTPAVAPSRESGHQKPQPQLAMPPAQSQPAPSTDLQHQPSLGFTSAVHHSFDAAQDQVPPTPSSVADSSIERSASGGTSVVSPIMSRGPSAANEPWNNTLPVIEDVTSPVQHQQLPSADQRTTPSAGKHSPSQTATEQPFDSQPSPPFIPGHRRNMSTPSPDNSPARTPVVEANRQLRTPQEIELAETTPTPTESEASADDHMVRGRRTTDQYPTPDQLALSEGRSRTTLDRAQVGQESAPTDLPSVPPTSFARERADSVGSGKIRDMPERIGGGASRPQSSHSNTTPRASLLPPHAPTEKDLVPPRPINEHMESFRPHLPGGWESSASIAPATHSSRQASPAQFKHDAHSIHTTPALNNPNSQKSGDNETPTAITQVKDASHDAFAAAASAGSALAASVAAAAGIGHKEGAEDSEEEWEKVSDEEGEPGRARGASVNTMVQSEMPKPPLDPRVDKERSEAPTPLLKDTPKNAQKETAGSDYFPGSAASDSPAVGDHGDDRLYKSSHDLPPLSTDLHSQRPEYESDRLRREIVQELAPNTVSEPSTAESTSPYPTSSKYSSNQSAGPSSSLLSGVASRNYWNNENSSQADRTIPLGDETGSQFQSANHVKPHQESATAANTSAPEGASRIRNPLLDEPRQRAPLETVESSQTPFEKPQTLTHRFSWEVPLQEFDPEPVSEIVSPASAATNPSLTHQLPTNDFPKPDVYPEEHSLGAQDIQERNALKRQSDQSSTVAETSTIGLNNSVKSRDGNREIAVDSHYTDAAIDQADTRATEEAKNEKALPSHPNKGPEAARYSSEKQFLESSPIDAGAEQQKTTPSPTVNERNPQLPTDMSIPTTLKAADAPLPPTPSNAQPNMPTFRSLLALKTPAERIRAYNSTREQFANLNTGLANWLFVTTSDLPEHLDLLSSQGHVLKSVQGHKRSTSRSGPSSGFPSASNQPTYAPGFSPSAGSGKISGKEVQAKSKELLHSAGVLSGKGIVAGKGLFSKGKNKLRGASGTDKALQSASSSSSPGHAFRGPREASKNAPLDSQARKSSRSRPVSDRISAEPQPHPSDSAESDRNTPSEQSYSKGQLGDDERSSEDYQSAESGPEEAGPLPPRSSSLFIGDKNGISRQSLPRSLASSGETARTHFHLTANAGARHDTQSPRSTNSSNKTPTQLSFDHSKAIPTPLERTESPQEVRGVVILGAQSQSSAKTQPRPFAPQGTHHPSQQGEASLDSEHPQNSGYEARSADEAIQGQLESAGARSAKRPPDIKTTNLTLPIPKFSPLMDEHNPGFSLSPETGRGSHSRGLSIGSVPSAIDPERPPSPVSPFVPPKDHPVEEQRGRPIVPKHHGIHHDFVEESSVERARRRSQSFSRPFQTDRSSEDSRPFARPDLQDHPALRHDSREPGPPDSYQASLASGERSPTLREQAPEYQASGQGAPDLPPVDTQSRSRRGSRSSAYLKAIRDSISPSRRSQTREISQGRENPQVREISQPALTDSPRATDSPPQSALRSPNPTDREERPRRSSIFGRLKSNNSSHSDQAQNKEHSTPRASTMPVQAHTPYNTGADGPVERNSPAGAKVNPASRLGQTLQRSSTSTNQAKLEPETGQKKRFSSIGSLFGRNQKRQSSDQFTYKPPIQFQQQSGKYTGRPNRPAQRFPLDEEEPDEAPSPANQAPFRSEQVPSHPNPPSQSPPQSQKELPAYVQDRMLRQPTAPIEQLQTQSNVPAPSEDFKSSRHKSQNPPVTRSSSSWARFSPSGRSNANRQSQPASSPSQQTSPPRPSDFVSSPPLTYKSRPTQRSWMEGTTPPPRAFPNPYPPPQAENSRPPRLEESPPPPPPPKDERWINSASRSSQQNSSSRHSRTGSVPMQQARSPAATQRQSLPPLQTNIHKSQPPPQTRQQQYRSGTPSSTNTAIREQKNPQPSSTAGSSAKDKDSMTPEEKRKSRQEEIEKGHLTPTTPVPTSAQRGNKMQVLREDEGPSEGPKPTDTVSKQDEDEPIVMSATSFPGQMWQPEYGGWDGD